MGFEEKRRIKFVTLVKGAALRFEDRLAYSFLLACSAGLTRTRLARLAGLDRTKTLPKLLARLTNLGLVAKEGQRYRGLGSEIVLLHQGKSSDDPWYERVCYLKYYLPSAECPLTKKQLAVYYLMLAGKTSTSLIAKLLNVSRPTVINARKVLKQRGLLDEFGEPLAVPPEKLVWWQEKRKTHAATNGNLERLSEAFQPMIEHFQRCNIDWIECHPWKAELDKFGRLCKEAGYCANVVELLDETATRLERNLVPVARVFRELPKLVQKAEERTKKNKHLGSYKGSSSYGLFLCKLNDLVKEEIRKAKGW